MGDQKTDRDREVVERIADEYAKRATRGLLKPDHGLSVLDSLAKNPARKPDR